MSFGRRMKNLGKLAQLEMPKNRGELYKDVNIAQLKKNWKTAKILINFSKQKMKILKAKKYGIKGLFHYISLITVLGNSVRKQH